MLGHISTFSRPDPHKFFVLFCVCCFVDLYRARCIHGFWNLNLLPRFFNV